MPSLPRLWDTEDKGSGGVKELQDRERTEKCHLGTTHEPTAAVDVGRAMEPHPLMTNRLAVTDSGR